MVAEARRRFPELRFEVADLTALPAPAGGGGWAAIAAWYSLVHLAGSELRPRGGPAGRRPPPRRLAGRRGPHRRGGPPPRPSCGATPSTSTSCSTTRAAVLDAFATAGLVDVEWYRRGPLPRRRGRDRAPLRPRPAARPEPPPVASASDGAGPTSCRSMAHSRRPRARPTSRAAGPPRRRRPGRRAARTRRSPSRRPRRAATKPRSFQASAGIQGRQFAEQCDTLLAHYGFELKGRRVLTEVGVEIDQEAVSPAGTTVWFEYKGCIQGNRPGLHPHRHPEEGHRQRRAAAVAHRPGALRGGHLAPPRGRLGRRHARRRPRASATSPTSSASTTPRPPPASALVAAAALAQRGGVGDRPMKSGVPVAMSWITKRNGRSTTSSWSGDHRPDRVEDRGAVAAAASVPCSSTVTVAWWTTSSRWSGWASGSVVIGSKSVSVVERRGDAEPLSTSPSGDRWSRSNAGKVSSTPSVLAAGEQHLVEELRRRAAASNVSELARVGHEQGHGQASCRRRGS